MKSIFLTLSLILPAQRAAASPCSDAQEGEPCTPDSEEELGKAQNDIRESIQAAQRMDSQVKQFEAKFRAVRNGPDKEAALAAFELYRAKKIAQGQLYKDVLD